ITITILYQSKDFILVTIPPASSLSTWRAGRTHPPTPSDIVTTLWSYKEKGRFRSIFWRSHSFRKKSLSPQAGCSTF
ncbi:MAG: hypothetical protein KJ666_12080, partial [Bacteroidetes bacterium]|nr:hypothetical protein [Bacteroidota bacterium]